MPVSEGPTNNKKTRFFAKFKLLVVLARIKCILLPYTTFPTKQWVRHEFLKNDFSESNQIYSTKKKLGQRNQRFGIGWSRRNPQSSPLIVAVIDNFAQTNIIFLISHLASTLKFFLMNLGKNLMQFEKFYYLNTNKTYYKTKFTNSGDAFLIHQTVSALYS